MNEWIDKFHSEQILEARSISKKYHTLKKIWTNIGKRELKVPRNGKSIMYKDIEVYPPVNDSNGKRVTEYEIPEFDWQGKTLEDSKNAIDRLTKIYKDSKDEFPKSKIKNIHDFIHISAQAWE
jgi:hypothetical protein